MKRRAKDPAPLRHGVRRRSLPYGAGCCRLVVIWLFSACLGCEAGYPLRSLDETSPNITSLSADNTCVKNVVQEGNYNYYTLDISGCLDINDTDDYLGVEARIYGAGPGCDDCQEWSLLVNTEGELPTYDDSTGQDGSTFTDSIDSEHQRPYTQLNLPLDGNTRKNWTVAVYSSSGPVQYTVKAWCSESKGCDLSCSDPDSGPCVSLETCRCIREADQDTCSIDVDELPDDEDIVSRDGLSIFHSDELLSHGEWKYFKFQALQNDSQILVQMDRAYGDVILYVKPYNGPDDDDDDDDDDGDDDVDDVDALPNVGDADEYADLESFQNRLSQSQIYIQGAGYYYIGVYNMDYCVKEDTTFNLTITISTPSNSMNLCPSNCSYPQGYCISAMHCECKPGYGGNFCEGSLWPAAPRKAYKAQLGPGEWAYVNMMKSQLTGSGNVSFSFSSSGGHCILLAQQSGYPTLKDFYLKFSNETLGATNSNTYEISRSAFDNGNVIIAVFNVDYQDRGVADFEIVIIGALKTLSIWIILAVALGSSIVVLIAMGTFRFVMQGKGRDDMSGMSSDNLDFEAPPQGTEMVEMRGVDRVMVSTFPLLAYQEGLFPQEDAGCSICLNNYNIAEILCRIPSCKHCFHVKCINKWFEKDSSCPLCRELLQADPSTNQSIEQLPGPLAPELRPPLLVSDTQVLVKGSDTQASSSISHFRREKPAPLTVKDDQPLLAQRNPSSLGSFSRSDSDSSPSLDVQWPENAALTKSIPQFR